jgi:hypothetical protein
MIPNPQIAINVIAVRKAVIAGVLFGSDFSSSLAPQRLQKVKPGVIAVPQFEQYILNSFPYR